MRVLPLCYCSESSFYSYSSLVALLFLPLILFRQPRAKRTDHPVSLFTLFPTVSLLPWIVCCLKDGITLQECPLVFQSLHHLHLSTLQPYPVPTKIVCLENVPTMMHHEKSAKMHFLPGGMKPGSAEDFCTGCIFNLKLDPELQSYNFAHGSFSSFICVPAACHYSTQLLNSLITLKVMVFSFLKDESLGFSLSVRPACCRQQLVTGGLQHIDTRC